MSKIIVEPRIAPYSYKFYFLLNTFIYKDHTKTRDFGMTEMRLTPPPMLPCAFVPYPSGFSLHWSKSLCSSVRTS